MRLQSPAMEVYKDGVLPKEIRLELTKLPRFKEAEGTKGLSQKRKLRKRTFLKPTLTHAHTYKVKFVLCCLLPIVKFQCFFPIGNSKEQ